MHPMDTDIIIYAVIAVLVFAKLWSVLGRRNDGDPAEDPNAPRFNPFAPKPVAEEDDEAPFRLEGKNGQRPGQGANPGIAANGSSGNMAAKGLPPPIISVMQPQRAAPLSLLGKLEAVKQLDATFDERAFLAEARAAFTDILADFAAGDLTRSKARFSDKVLGHFQAAIDARQAAGQTLSNTLVRIRDVEVSAVDMEGTRITLTVRYMSDQKNIIRDGSGAIVDGEDRVEEIIDLWSFARDVAQLSSNWILVETKS